MSRYITELSIPNDMDFFWRVEDLIQQGHKEYSFTRFKFYDDSEKYPLGLFSDGLHLLHSHIEQVRKDKLELFSVPSPLDLLEKEQRK